MALTDRPLPTGHIPVMLGQVLAVLAPEDGGIYVDGTFGAGGYSRALLEAADTRVYGIDRDPDAIGSGLALLAAFPDRLALIEGRFSDMAALLQRRGIGEVDGVALDIGVSSGQLDEPERGFSFLKDGPLDMRMERAGPSAADAVNSLEPGDLTRIIGVLGEETKARAIAKAIVAARARAPILATAELAALVERILGKHGPKSRIHPATRTFQALRIYVNRELEELALGLAAAERMLKVGGRLAVVTFHSLEDRIVKRFLAERAAPKPAPSRHLPESGPAPAPSFRFLFRGHRSAEAAEIAANPRARSAKLRAAERTAAPAILLDQDASGVPHVSQRRN